MSLGYTADLAATVRDLASREAIRDVIYRHCHGIDRRDWQVLNAVFWPDSQLEYGLYNDSSAGLPAIIEQLFGQLKIDITQHFIGNCILRVNGDSADGETYVHRTGVMPTWSSAPAISTASPATTASGASRCARWFSTGCATTETAATGP